MEFLPQPTPQSPTALLPAYAPIHDVFADVQTRMNQVAESQALQLRKLALMVGIRNVG
jgi:hypothetical protein